MSSWDIVPLPFAIQNAPNILSQKLAAQEFDLYSTKIVWEQKEIELKNELVLLQQRHGYLSN